MDKRKLGSRIPSDAEDLDVKDTQDAAKHPAGDTLELDDGTVLDLSKLGTGQGAFDAVPGLVVSNDDNLGA